MRNTKSDARVWNNAMYYTTRLLAFLAVTGGVAAAIVLSLFGAVIAGGINLFG